MDRRGGGGAGQGVGAWCKGEKEWAQEDGKWKTWHIENNQHGVNIAMERRRHTCGMSGDEIRHNGCQGEKGKAGAHRKERLRSPVVSNRLNNANMYDNNDPCSCTNALKSTSMPDINTVHGRHAQGNQKRTYLGFQDDFLHRRGRGLSRFRHFDCIGGR